MIANVGFGLGDANSDYLAYEAALAAAYASGNNQNIQQVTQNVPVDINGGNVPQGSLNTSKLTMCTPANCPGPYDSAANYKMWVQQNQAWGIDLSNTPGAINTPVTLVVPKGQTPEPNLAPYVYSSQQIVQKVTNSGNYTQSSGTTIGGKVAQLSWTNSRGGSILYPGDTWTISIVGGPNNAPVVTSGVAQGQSFNTSFGVTDSGGNWSKSGVIDSTEVGNWSEDWFVSGIKLGNISFTVAPLSALTATPQSKSPGVNPTVNAPPLVTTPSIFDLFGDTSGPIMIGSSFGIGEYTALGLAAVVVAGLVMMDGKGRR